MIFLACLLRGAAVVGLPRSAQGRAQRIGRYRALEAILRPLLVGAAIWLDFAGLARILISQQIFGNSRLQGLASSQETAHFIHSASSALLVRSLLRLVLRLVGSGQSLWWGAGPLHLRCSQCRFRLMFRCPK